MVTFYLLPYRDRRKEKARKYDSFLLNLQYAHTIKAIRMHCSATILRQERMRQFNLQLQLAKYLRRYVDNKKNCQTFGMP